MTKQPKQPSNQENTLDSLLPSLCPGQTSLLNRMKKSRFWQAIHCSKAQKASQKTPFESGKHPGTPPAVPLPGPNVTPEPNEKKSRCWQAIPTVSGAETKPQDTLQIRKTSCGLFCVPGKIACQTLDFSFGSGVTFWPRQRDGRRLFRHAVPGCFPDLKGALARRDETASCPEPNEKIKGLAGNCSRHTKQATRHPSNQEKHPGTA